MAKKRSVDTDVAGFDKQHGPHSQIECTAAAGGAANVNLDCDDPLPNNEPDIEVNPTDSQHLIASSNDFGTCCDQFYTTARACAGRDDRSTLYASRGVARVVPDVSVLLSAACCRARQKGISEGDGLDELAQRGKEDRSRAVTDSDGSARWISGVCVEPGRE